MEEESGTVCGTPSRSKGPGWVTYRPTEEELQEARRYKERIELLDRLAAAACRALNRRNAGA